MRRYGSLGDLPLGGPRRAVAIGAFDGVHLGHQAIIGRAIEIGRQRGLPTMVLTFEPNPIAVLRPELRTSALTEPELKAALIERLGADELLAVPFTMAFSRIKAERFAEMLVSAPVGADAIVVGPNFRFGHRGAGTVAMLESFGRSRGLAVETPQIVNSDDGKPISSTRIRRLISQGQIGEAAALLGRPHGVDGVIVHGDQRGRALGLPTANLEPPDLAALPGRGVYAGWMTLSDGRHAAAINVGHAPTFTAGQTRAPLRVEAFLVDYAGPDLYGRRARLEFAERLRDERRFPSPQELIAQVERDVRRAREITGVA